MADITEVTSQSWLGRIGSSIKGVVFGLVLFVAAFPVLFINEGCAVKRAKTLEASRGAVVEGKIDTVDPAFEGKLVHLVGEAKTEEVLSDSTFGISDNALKLRRKVEIYQVQEDKDTESRKKLGGGKETKTTYTYREVWSDGYIDSSKFKDESKRGLNKPSPWPADEKVAKVVTFGAHELSDSLKGQINKWEKVPVTDGHLSELKDELKSKFKVHDGVLCTGDPASPKLNDVRISFEVVRPCKVSVLAAQQGTTFGSYKHEDADPQEPRLVVGEKSAEEMISGLEAQNKIRTWALRAGGFVVMTLGLLLILAPLAVLGDVVPIIGSIIGMGTFIVAAVVGFGLSLVTIAVGWVFYRPLIGIPLLVIGVAGIAWVIYMARKRLAPAEQPAM